MNKSKIGLLFFTLFITVNMLSPAFSQIHGPKGKERKESFYYKPIVKIVNDLKNDLNVKGKDAKNLQENPQSLLGSFRDINNKGMTLLLIGTDNRPQEKYIGNTDSLMLIKINPETSVVGVLSIPRDTQIEIPGYGKMKINSAARIHGSMMGAVSAAERLLNVPIDGYITVNFSGFKKIIDTIGGITVEIEKDMYYETGDSEDGIINLKKGIQRLNGEQALQYVRFRNDSLGDISRTQRQQKVIKAIFAEIRKSKNLYKIPALISIINDMVSTNLEVSQLITLGKMAGIEDLEIVSQTLPGKAVMENGVSYWKVDSELCQDVINLLFAEGNEAEDPSVNGQ